MSRRGDWIQTYSGRQFWPLDPRPDEICIDDIAHALSMLCRFGGHCTRFMSVAEHSINVSKIISPTFALQGLLHDAAEAYLLDIPRPVKRMIEGYRDFERAVQNAIWDWSGVRQKETVVGLALRMDAMWVADNRMLHTEMLALLGPPPVPWESLPTPLAGFQFAYYTPEQAEAAFLQRFRDVAEAAR